MIEKVGVYCRLSNEDRNKENRLDDSNSIVNQKSMCIKYARERGWNVIDIYSDDDFSGAGTYRPEFERLIADCENGRINIVLCKTQSRFSRDLEVIEKYLHAKFIEWGVRFVSIVDNADTSIESNKKSRQINGLMNEWYLADLSVNIKKSLKNKREDGLFMGSFAPYGYERSSEDKHKLVIDPVAAVVVKKIFEMYANGYGYYKICEYLNDNNIPTRTVYKMQKGSNYKCPACDLKNARWNMDTIAQILRHEVYIGNLVQGKVTSMGYKIHKFRNVAKADWCRIENTHEAIVDIDTWNRVQKRLGNHQTPTKDGKVHCFSRKVYCSCCGKSFQRNVYRVNDGKTNRRAYLQCKGNKRYHICDNNKSIRLDELERIVLNAINEMLNNFYDKNIIKTNYEFITKKNSKDKERVKLLEKERKALEDRVKEIRSYFKKLYEDKLKGLINDEMFVMMSDDYSNEMEEHIKKIDVISNEITSIETEAEQKKKADEIFKKYKSIKEINKVVVDEFIDRIYIGAYDKNNKTRDIEIIWNFEI